MNKTNKFSKIWSILFLTIVLGYLIFIFTKTVLKNYSINQQIYRLQKETQVSEEENLRLKNLIAYYQSDSYKDRMARLLLNYKLPDEKVIAFPNVAAEQDDFKLQDTNIDTRTNLQKWYDFIIRS